MTTSFIEFAFIVVLPLVLVAGGLVSLFAVGALFDALEDPQGLRARIDAAFRSVPGVARIPGPGHYYRRHWLEDGKPPAPVA